MLETRHADERLAALRTELRDAIRAASAAGIAYPVIGECAGLSKQRIASIVAGR